MKMQSEQDLLARIRKAKVKQERVRIWDKEIGPKGMEYLCSRKVLQVNEIVLWCNDILPEGMRFFPKAQCDKLFFLQINQNHSEDLGCKYLSRTAFARIQEIKLSFKSIGNTGLYHLSKEKSPALNKIDLCNNKITECGKSISKAYWQKINWIKLSSNCSTELEVILLLCFPSRQMGQIDLCTEGVIKFRTRSTKIHVKAFSRYGKLSITIFLCMLDRGKCLSFVQAYLIMLKFIRIGYYQMKIVKISACILIISLLLLLHFPLLYCNDPSFCHFPVTSYPRNQLAYRIRRLLSRPDYLFLDLMHFANNFLVVDAVLIMYIVTAVIRKNIGNIVRIAIVSIVLLYAVYRYDQYTRKHGPIPIKEIPTLLKAYWQEISSKFWEFIKTKEEN